MDKLIFTGPVDDKELSRGAKDFEIFWLRPKKMSFHETVLRMKINKKWGGWKLKDELVKSLGLEVGDTINTEVSVLESPGLIDDTDDTDLFASGEGADWLLENDVGLGSIIDAKVRFVYAQAPVGGREGRPVWKISLVFVEGYNVVKGRTEYDEEELERWPSLEALRRLMED